MSRKDASFAQLVAYLHKGSADDRYVLTHNLYARETTAMIAELEQNAALLRPRKNGVVLYHEIVSITRPKALPLDRQKEILQGIAERYVELRAPECLVYGRLHEDKPHHLHYHLAISANKDGSRERHSLKKAEFRKMLVALEADVLARHPELEQKVAIANTAMRARSNTEGEVERRTRRPSDKSRIAAAVRTIIAKANAREDIEKELKAAGLTLYQRGKTFGVLDETTGRKHRLKTLGLDDDLAAFRMRVAADWPAPAIANTEIRAIHSSDGSGAQAPSQPQEMETDVNILEAALQGLGAFVDTISITTDVGKPLDDTKGDTLRRASQILDDPALQENERERIVAERRAEIERIRDGLDDNLSEQQSRKR